ncbi:MAG: APC family permease [Acidobacteriota bacterium]|nr:APC family permease [Acidobacteriota bacterium]
MDSAERVEQQSTGLKKELGLRDLVLAQILYVVGSGWVGTAAKLGNSHIVFWLAAVVLFYVPLAMVVVWLNRRMPLEGGLYQWAKLGFNEFVGFMVAWNLWLYIILFMSTLGVMLSTNLSYAFSAPWMSSSKSFIALVMCLLALGLVVVTTVGLGIGKWVQNFGGFTQILTFGALILLPWLYLGAGPARDYHPLAAALPALSLFSLNVFGKMAMGAFSGFEYVAILAGETRNAGRNIGRSVMIAAPAIALMFILGTSSVLAFVRPEDVDLVGPIPQVLSLGLRRFGWAGPAIPVVILLLAGRQLGAATLAVAGSSRLPMVTGWDHLLPAWFSRLHPKFKTPVNSILFVGAMILGMGLAGIAGVGHQEAFQLLDNASGIFYGLTYLVMFALPLIGLKNMTPRPPWWLRAAAGSGFLVTLLYCVLSIFPIVQVESWFVFSAKIAGVVVGANLLGAMLFLSRRKPSRKV